MNILKYCFVIGTLLSMISCGGNENSRPKLVGGEKFEKGNASAAVGLLFKRNGSEAPLQTTRTCTGTVLKDDIILTTASCLNGYKDQKLTLVFVVASDGTKLKAPSVKAVRLHPSYAADDGLLSPYNVALIKLSKSLGSNLIQHASLSFQKPKTDQAILTIGAGCEQASNDGACQGPYSILKYLKALTTSVVDNPEAGSDFKDSWFFSKTSDGFTADGDEGGPVFVKDGYVVGINTFRKGLTQSRVPAYLWLGNPELQGFLSDLDFNDPVPPFIDETTRILGDIKNNLDACNYDTKKDAIFERFVDRVPDGPVIAPACPVEVKVRDLRIRTFLLAAAHIERAEKAFQEGRFDEAQALKNTAKEFLIAALNIGLDISPLGRVKSAIECYLGQEILPEYRQLGGWEHALACISAVGLDETIVKYGFAVVVSTKLGKVAIKRVEAFASSFNYATRLKQKLLGILGEDFERIVTRMKTRLGPATTQEEIEALTDLGKKMGAKEGDDFLHVTEVVGDTTRLKSFRVFAEKLEPLEGMLSKLRKVEGAPELPVYIEQTFQSHEIFEVTEPIFLARYYDSTNAKKLGGFWSNRIFKSKADFYKGSVVFPEWNSAEHLVLIKVEKGERIALGKIGPQEIQVNGVFKNLPKSEEIQVFLPTDMNSDFIKGGGEAKNWLEYLISQGKISELETLDLPKEW